jgi:hypothetical protein
MPARTPRRVFVVGVALLVVATAIPAAGAAPGRPAGDDVVESAWACSSTFVDEFWDNRLGVVDVTNVALTERCPEDVYELGIGTDFHAVLPWNLLEASFSLDVDGSDQTGCDGADHLVVVGWDDALGDLTGGLFTTPTCDEATWTSPGELLVSLPNGAVSFEFARSAIGDPVEIRWFARLLGRENHDLDGALDRVPNTGWGTWSGMPDGPASGYWMVDETGVVHAFGQAYDWGDTGGTAGEPIVDLEPVPLGDGYWLVDAAGGVQGFGPEAFEAGEVPAGTLRPGERVTSLAATPDASGYWIFTTLGRVLPFGDAPFLGDMSSAALNGPVLDSIVTPSGLGYYMVGSDGGIFAFGDARFFGSMGGTRINAPVQALVPDPDGTGYWLVATDGGVFAFEAPFRGSMGGVALNRPVTGMVPLGDGYLMVGEDGGVFSFSDRPFHGSLGDDPPAHPIVSVASFSA